MGSLYIIGDVHGCYRTLEALLNKMPTGCTPILVGDLVDRGPRNREVINFVRDNRILSVRGNHEIMMYNKDPEEMVLWRQNGGHTTWSEYHKDGVFDKESFDKDCDYLEGLPIYLEFDVEYQGMKALVSHSTLASHWLYRHRSEVIEESVWERKNFPAKIPGYFNVFGHTPVIKPIVKEHFANVDTGCVFHNYGKYGWLTALQFPEMIIHQQKYIDQYC